MTSPADRVGGEPGRLTDVAAVTLGPVDAPGLAKPLTLDLTGLSFPQLRSLASHCEAINAWPQAAFLWQAAIDARAGHDSPLRRREIDTMMHHYKRCIEIAARIARDNPMSIITSA